MSGLCQSTSGLKGQVYSMAYHQAATLVIDKFLQLTQVNSRNGFAIDILVIIIIIIEQIL